MWACRYSVQFRVRKGEEKRLTFVRSKLTAPSLALKPPDSRLLNAIFLVVIESVEPVLSTGFADARERRMVATEVSPPSDVLIFERPDGS